MAGSTYGTLFKITTWGESHGAAIGVVIDGCPAGLSLCETDIQSFLDRRKPGQSRYTTKRNEGDKVEILSGIFEGKTTGTPISLIVRNEDQISRDYGNIKDCYRPGHADYTFSEKYGFRDYRGGGRSSGRETIGRVAAGAVASRILQQLGIEVRAYTKAIGNIVIPENEYDFSCISQNSLQMPNQAYALRAAEYLEECMKNQDSSGGIIECSITGLPVGIGEPVFEKLDANLAKAIMSIGAVKGVEIGDGFHAASANGSSNNDPFRTASGGHDIQKATNHSGGTLGGMSDGSTLILRAAVKPTPSISRVQQTVNTSGDEIELSIHGRHDPVIVPRAVVVVESMAALTLIDMLLINMSAKLENIIEFYK
ncbi:chorismate synthase [Dorea acetigenes]|uniref:Chorismate synthase n=1 Tax=Dorea acetigenes TaxID=2981787 RepID=A0ABT2RMS9_9FIRM|nr:chorismate synthase [Dorea acetigenes]MCB6414615.1 chorismate synthase [Faecalimonas umbilicata]MCU6686695.1 chorismate synthase [Dorea acetigenes]SCJ07032.1 Chorismate synthase [uncultured Clostridium sp.]